MTSVTVVILHVEPAADAGPLTRALGAARTRLAETHRVRFAAAGADRVDVVAGPPDGVSFGARLRAIAHRLPDDGGLVILGSGAVPLLSAAERRTFVRAAAGPMPAVLANNAYSADIVAVAAARSALADVPDLATDNALPRWLAERAGLAVTDLRRRWRLGVDIDSPLDLVLLGRRWSADLPSGAADRAAARLDAVRAVAADPSAELLVAGRTSPDSLTWLERSTAARTRALVEERGLRTSQPGQRPPASVLGLLLDRDRPAALATHLPRLADAALIDTRVLLAHRLGADERGWPSAEDRFASDLLAPDAIEDPWLRALTQAALDAPTPVVLGGHTLVGPGLRLALRVPPRRAATA
ncbi:MAG: hypothetical protein ACSLFN_06755 [Candidatus Limnocylindrales bacterium]